MSLSNRARIKFLIDLLFVHLILLQRLFIFIFIDANELKNFALKSEGEIDQSKGGARVLKD